jgi:hypothetical protein
VRTTGRATWALGFTAVARASGTAVGSCAFKGPPDAAGSSSVAYGPDPARIAAVGSPQERRRALTGSPSASGPSGPAHTKRERGVGAVRPKWRVPSGRRGYGP